MMASDENNERVGERKEKDIIRRGYHTRWIFRSPSVYHQSSTGMHDVIYLINTIR